MSTEARWHDGQVHLYRPTDTTRVEPLHGGESHARADLSEQVTRPQRLDMCPSCAVAARPKTTAVPPPRPRAGRHPEQDAPTPPAGTAQDSMPAGAPAWRQP